MFHQTMVLYEKGAEKYFADDLLTFLREKKNDEVRRILEEYQPSGASLTVSRLKDSSESTLLHYAAEYGNEEIAKLLIDLGSEVDAQDELGRSPLILALTGKHMLVIQVLLGANADLRITNVDGKCAFQMILEFRKDFADILEEDFGRKGVSLIQVAVFRSAPLIKWFIDRGHAVNAKDKESGITALHAAVMMCNLEMTKLLIDHGADVDALDNANKFTPLMCLPIHLDKRDVSDEYAEIVSILLSHMTLLTASNNHGRMQISSLLVFGCYKAVDQILKRVDNLFVSDEQGYTIAHYMACNKDEQVIELLRDREFNVNARNREGAQPLHLAVVANLPHNVKFLLEYGADVNNPGGDGKCPLCVLFYTLNIDSRLDDLKKCIELLLEYGSDPFEADLGKIFDLVSQRYAEAAQQDDQAKEPKNILVLMEPIIAIFAIKKSLRPQMIELVNSEIQRQPTWVEYFEMCKGLVDQMSKTTISGTVTVLRFLMESQDKITTYARNDELVCELKKHIEEFESNSPYLNLLRHRFTKAVEAAELKKKAVAAICWLINLKNNAHYFAAEYIVSYLSNGDMKNLDSVKQLCCDNEGSSENASGCL